METPVLRVARTSDAAAIEQLMQQSAAGIFPGYYTDEQVASAVRYIAQPDPMLLEDGTYFVLEADGELVACGGWSRRVKPYMGSADGEGDDRLLDPATDAAHIRAMFVRPDWTRRGLGRRIMEACETAARAAGFHRLTLVATMPGVPLYTAAGFVPSAEVEDIVLTDGTLLPCLEMHRDLVDPPGGGSTP